MNKLIISIFTLLMVAVGAMAQTATVTGTVTDDYGPVIGATVIVQGTTLGCTTDLDGKFTLTNVPDVNKAVLKISFVGMEEVKEPLKGRTSGINIHMTESASMLEDVVVIGYGTQKRGNLTGSISSVSGKILEKVQTTSAAEAIVGKLPGVQVTTVDGSPDAEVKILVRGGGSITQDNSPLIILDGFEVNSLNDVPPTDIESIEVLKDAASTAIYGARGANGVILVTTKNPTEGRVSVSLNTYVQTKTLSNKLDVMNPYEFVLMQYENARQKSSNPTDFNNKYGHAYEHYIYQGDPGTDWQDEVFGTHPVASYLDLSVNGGTEKAKYKLAFIHQDQPSVMVGNGLKQNNLNASFNLKPFKFLTMEYRTRLLHKEVDGSGTEGVSLLDALRQAPTEGLDEYMTLPEDDTYFDPDQLEEVVRFNPKEESEKNYKKRINKSLNTMGALTWEIKKGLTLRNEFGFENNTEEQRKFWGMGTKNAKNNNNQPMAEWMMKQGTKWQLTNVLNYNFTLDDDAHDIRLMLGQEIKHQQTKTKTYSTRYFPENTTAEQAFDNLSLGTPYENSSKADSPSRISSFFGRINYGYKDKYLATFTLRADGSSKFASNNRWGFFPGVSLGWRVSEEAFFKKLLPDMDNLKIRASYAKVGDEGDFDAFQYLDGYTSHGSYIMGSNGVTSGMTTVGMANPWLTWYESKIMNIGFEASYHRGLISVEFDWFRRNRSGLPATRVGSLPTIFGESMPQENLNSDINTGFEIVVGHKNRIGNFNYNVSANFSTTRIKYDYVERAASTNMYDDWRNNTNGRYKDIRWGKKVIGQFTSFEEILNSPVQDKDGNRSLMPGDLKFEDYNGDGIIDDNDTQPLGHGATPRMYYGLNMSGEYKGFDLTVFFQGAAGHDIYVSGDILDPFIQQGLGNGLAIMTDRWHREDPTDPYSKWIPGYMPAARVAGVADNRSSNSWSLHNASYLRLKTLELGYTLPKVLTKKAAIDRVRFYINCNNLLTFTKRDGLMKNVDPESNSSGIRYYPQMKTYNFGVNVTF